MPYMYTPLQWEHDCDSSHHSQDSLAYLQQIWHVNSAFQAHDHSLMYSPMYQALILHPPDFHYYPTTPHHCLRWAGWPLICPQALSFSCYSTEGPLSFSSTCDPACDPQTRLLEGMAWSHTKSCQRTVYFSFHYLVTILFLGQNTRSRSANLYLWHFPFV